MHPAANGCLHRLAYAQATGTIREQTPARKRAVCPALTRITHRRESNCRDGSQKGSDAVYKRCSHAAGREVAFGSTTARSKPVSPVPAGLLSTARRAPSMPKSLSGNCLSWIAFGLTFRSW